MSNKNNSQDSIEFLENKLKILKYIQATSIQARDDIELSLELSCIFDIHVSDILRILTILRKENNSINWILERKKKMRKKPHHKKAAKIDSQNVFSSSRSYPKIDYQKKTIFTVKPLKTKAALEEAKSSLKEIKPIDGFESEWKEGKMSPVIQKNYRSTYQDKD